MIEWSETLLRPSLQGLLSRKELGTGNSLYPICRNTKEETFRNALLNCDFKRLVWFSLHLGLLSSNIPNNGMDDWWDKSFDSDIQAT